MVIMDRQDYISKANNLLSQNTYKTIQQDPTNSIKKKLITILKGLKVKQALATKLTKLCTPQDVSPKVLWPPQDPQARYTTKAHCIQLWISYLWGGQRACQNPQTPSRQVPPPHKQHPGLCRPGQTHHSSTRGMPSVLMMCLPCLHQSP